MARARLGTTVEQLRHRAQPSGRFGAVVLVEEPHLASEVVDALESLVDAGEPQVGDVVERPEAFEDGQPHLLASSPRSPLPAWPLRPAWATASSCSSVTGRFLVAERNPGITLTRSNGSRRPDRFTTISGTSSMRSKVVYRRPHPAHSRRRRMAAPVLGQPRVDHSVIVSQAPGTPHTARLPPDSFPTFQSHKASIAPAQARRSPPGSSAVGSGNRDVLARRDRVGTRLLFQLGDERPGVTRGVRPLGDGPQRVARLHRVGDGVAGGLREGGSGRVGAATGPAQRESKAHHQQRGDGQQGTATTDAGRNPSPGTATVVVTSGSRVR